MENKSFVGIDVSKKTIDASIFVPGARIESFWHAVFTNDRKGFDEMFRWLKTFKVVLTRTLFGLEYTGEYSVALEKYLTVKKYTFCMLATNIVKHYQRGPRDKSDKTDSAKIADYLYRFHDTECTKPYEMPSKTMQRLKEMKNRRKFLVNQRTAFMNRIQVCEMVEERSQMQSYIDKFDRDIEKLEREEVELLETEQELIDSYNSLCSVPGVGHVNAINAIVITRNFTAFDTARQYARYVGVAPCSHTSGTSVKWRSRPSPRYDGQAKADLSMAATRAVQRDMQMNIFYNHKLHGKRDPDSKKKAMNAVKFKLVTQMFAVVKQHRKWVDQLDAKKLTTSTALQDTIAPNQVN